MQATQAATSAAKAAAALGDSSSKTPAEIEKETGLVTGKNSGCNLSTLVDWRNSGRLKVRRDCILLAVRGDPKTWFYLPSAIARERARPPLGARKFWQGRKRLTEGSETLLCQSEATSFLGVSDCTLWKWTNKGCRFLPGNACLTWTLRDGIRYWLLSELEALQVLRAKTPRVATGEGICSVEETAELLDVKPSWLRVEKHSEKLRLVRATKSRVLIRCKRKNGKPRRGRSTAGESPANWLMGKKVISFTRESVNAALQASRKVPRDKVTVAAVVERLNLQPATVSRSCKDGLLDAELAKPGDYSDLPLGGWLIAESSVRDAERIAKQLGGKGHRGNGGIVAGLKAAKEGSAEAEAQPIPALRAVTITSDSTTATAPPAMPVEKLMSADALAALFGLPSGRVNVALSRLASTDKECRKPVEDPDKDDPKYLYRVQSVWSKLVRLWNLQKLRTDH